MDLDEIIYNVPFFSNSQNEDIGLSHLFYVKLNKKEDLKILDELSLTHNVEIIGSNKFMPLWYTLSCTKRSTGNALTMANLFFETGLFSASEPDLMVDDILQCVDDTFFNDQWNLNNTGQYGGDPGVDIDICDAWEMTMGVNNVVVAVLDQGIEMNHPDLLNMSPLSFDTESGTSPSVVLGSHGTACAGIIGASADNNLGIAGVAPNCQLMSISNSMAGTPNSRQRRGDGINWAWQNGADVISNSWGSGVQYQIIDDAIDNALINGRNGLGCVVVFASGNDNSSVNYPANSDSDIIAVGAMSMCGERKSPSSCDGENWGSNYGSSLDLIAPGVLIPTTDRQGNNGYNPYIPIHILNGGTLITNDYDNTDFTIWFNGTSSACPQVAGIAALMLSVNPSLTQDEIRDIIESTCTKIGNYGYSTVTGRTNGTWDDEMGYGLVKACEAVFEALIRILSVTGPSIECTYNSTFTLHNRPPGTTVNWTKSNNLSYVSGQYTNSYTVKAVSSSTHGWGWVEATIDCDCGDVTFREDFWVGEPANVEIHVPVEPIIGEVEAMVWVSSDPGNETYNWQVIGGTIVQDNGDEIILIADCPSRRGLIIRVQAINNCGQSNWVSRHVAVDCSSGGVNPLSLPLLPPFTLSPNPADDFVELNVTQYYEESLTAKANMKYEVRIFSTIKKPLYNQKSSKPVLRINTSDFKEGIYFVYLIIGDEVFVEQLVISH
jgi:subtilisin family serine protease